MTKEVLRVLTQKENALCTTLDELAIIKATPKGRHKSIFKTALKQLSDYPEKVFYNDNGISFPKELQADCRVKVAKELLQLAAAGGIESVAGANTIEGYISCALEKIQSLIKHQ